MLSLRITPGDYIAIGDNIIVQVSQAQGAAFNVSIDAPRDIPIVHGALHEKTTARPDCIQRKWENHPPKKPRATQPESG